MYKKRDRETTRLVREKTLELWKIPTPDDSSLTREFSLTEFATALQKLKPGKAPGPDQICPELILHAGPTIKPWLCKFLSSCLCQLRIIPQVWRRSLVVAILKPTAHNGKPSRLRHFEEWCFTGIRSGSPSLEVKTPFCARCQRTTIQSQPTEHQGG